MLIAITAFSIPFRNRGAECWESDFSGKTPNLSINPPKNPNRALCFVLCRASVQQNVSGRVHGFPLIRALENLVLPAHLLCFYSLYMTPSHVLGLSSHDRKVSGRGQPSLKHSFGRFKPSSECSIFTLLELVGLRGSAQHKITRGRNRNNQSKASACENARRGGFAPQFCASKQAGWQFPTRAHLCFVGHHSVITHEPPITV